MDLLNRNEQLEVEARENLYKAHLVEIKPHNKWVISLSVSPSIPKQNLTASQNHDYVHLQHHVYHLTAFMTLKTISLVFFSTWCEGSILKKWKIEALCVFC